MRKEIIAVVIVFGFVGIAQADIVELDLFTLGCPSTYDYDSPSWTSDFDLEVTFTEIFHVYIDWSGGITAGMAAHSDDPDNPFPLDVGINASLDYPPLRTTEVWGGEATYPDPEPFDRLSEIAPETSVWSDLLDGQSTITIEYREFIILPGGYVEHGSVDLTSATLVVDGLIVPEPASILLLAMGTLFLRAKYPAYRFKP